MCPLFHPTIHFLSMVSDLWTPITSLSILSTLKLKNSTISFETDLQQGLFNVGYVIAAPLSACPGSWEVHSCLLAYIYPPYPTAYARSPSTYILGFSNKVLARLSIHYHSPRPIQPYNICATAFHNRSERWIKKILGVGVLTKQETQIHQWPTQTLQHTYCGLSFLNPF
jgi:hypothetical protein